MIMRALSFGLGIVGLGLPVAAQGTRSSDGLARRPLDGDGSLLEPAFEEAMVVSGHTLPAFPSLALTEQGPFVYPATFAWMDASASAYLPPFEREEPRRAHVARSRSLATRDRLAYGDLDETGARRLELHGEVGFLYGRATGKDGGSFNQTYIRGELGNDKFRLSVGAAYSDWDLDGRRYRRR